MPAKRIRLLFRAAIPITAAVTCFALLASAQTHGSAQTPAEQWKDLLSNERSEIKEFDLSTKNKAKDTIPADRDPRLKWFPVLWKFREQNPGTPEAAIATAESIRLQVQAGRIADALVRVDSLAPDDKAWGDLLIVLRDAAERTGDAEVFFLRARALLAHTENKPLRARIQYNIGRVHQIAGRDDEAIAAYKAAAADGEELEYAKVASGRIYDLTMLRVGLPAPEFSVTALSGKRISSASLREHTAVFVFWASW